MEASAAVASSSAARGFFSDEEWEECVWKYICYEINESANEKKGQMKINLGPKCFIVVTGTSRRKQTVSRDRKSGVGGRGLGGRG